MCEGFMGGILGSTCGKVCEGQCYREKEVGGGRGVQQVRMLDGDIYAKRKI